MYHYGVTIREYREKAKMTQQQLAERWPKSERFGGGEGVNPTYIQDIEGGRKRIDSAQTLRKVCGLLSIPLWKVGLGEYDPFTATLTGKSTYQKTFETHRLYAAASVDTAQSFVVTASQRSDHPTWEYLSLLRDGQSAASQVGSSVSAPVCRLPVCQWRASGRCHALRPGASFLQPHV